jgi:hypothetical protein
MKHITQEIHFVYYQQDAKAIPNKNLPVYMQSTDE